MALLKFKRSATPAKVPTIADLELGELALNTYDGKIYMKKDDGTQSIVDITGSGGAGGTVTSVAASAGTGISVTGSPITTSGTLTITNTAPDQVVSLTGAGTTTVTGTYPNFTITSNDQFSGTVTSVAASGGTTGLTFSGSPITTSGTLTLDGTLAVANGGTGVTTSTGTGSVVLNTGPTLVTPTLGAASATSIANGLGAAGTPSYTFTGDLNTGMWSPAADTIAFSEGGAERMRIDSSGDVLVGKTVVDDSTIGVRLGRVGFVSASRNNNPGIILNRTGSDGDIAHFRREGSNVGTISVTTTGTSYNTSIRSGITGVDANTVAIRTNFAERMRITSAGNVVLGHTSSLSIAGRTSLLQTYGANLYAGVRYNSASSAGANFNFARSRSATVGSFGVVSANDAIASINFSGDDGTAFVDAASIIASVDGTPGVGDMPGRLQFLTTADGAASPTERMRITSAGNVGIGTSSPTDILHLSRGAGLGIILERTGATASVSSVSNTANLLILSTNSPGGVSFNTGSTPTERARFDPNGNFLFATTTSSASSTLDGFYVANSTSGLFSRRTSGAAQVHLTIINGGTTVGSIVSSTTATNYNTSTTSGITGVDANTVAIRTNSAERFRITSTGGITSSDLADAVGYKGVPQNAQTSAYTLALSDMGKHISITTGGVTIPANASVAFPIGATIVIYNDSAASQTISITTDILRQAGTGIQGSRTLLQYGLATVVKVAATTWVISGAGVR